MYLPIVLCDRRHRPAKLCEHSAVEWTRKPQLIQQTEPHGLHGVAYFPPHVVVSISEPRSDPHFAQASTGYTLHLRYPQRGQHAFLTRFRHARNIGRGCRFQNRMHALVKMD